MNFIRILFMVFFLFSLCGISAQVAINEDGSPAANTAILDLKSTEKGLLIPRMTQSERDAILDPETGLIIFNTTGKTINYYTGTTWRVLMGSECPLPEELDVIVGVDSVCAGDIGVAFSVLPSFGATSYEWSCSAGATITSGQGTHAISVDITGTGSFYLIVKASNECGETNNINKTITINEPLSFDLQPADMSTYAGAFALFEVSVIGDPNTQIFQWQVNTGDAFVDLTIEDYAYSGIFSKKLWIQNVGETFVGYQYRCVVSNACTTITSDVGTLTEVDTYPCNWFNLVADIDGNEYHTIIVGNQCWLAENLRVGTILDSYTDMEDNGEIEKYCYDNIETNCNDFGGLYKWYEMMQYDTIEGSAGICPVGFHIPTDEEWKINEGWSETNFALDYAFWDNEGWRGIDAGSNMKDELSWNVPGDDYYGFSALPGGYIDNIGDSFDMDLKGNWWTSSSIPDTYQKIFRRLEDYNNKVYRDASTSETNPYRAYSVRCIRD